MDELRESIDVDVEQDDNGDVRRAKIRFGPHHAVEVWKDGEKTLFALVATHHGFKVDASELNGDLERIINQVREANPDAAVD
jgi:hypothetical protein